MVYNTCGNTHVTFDYSDARIDEFMTVSNYDTTNDEGQIIELNPTDDSLINEDGYIVYANYYLTDYSTIISP